MLVTRIGYRRRRGFQDDYPPDTWAIDADTFEIGYTHPIDSGWTIEGRFRSYSQTKADFYDDLFSRSRFQNFMARDKELSTFSSNTIRFAASYDIVRGGWKFIERGTLNVVVDHMMFDYEDFRDLRVTGGVAGSEPLYTFDANVVQLFASFWF